MDPAKWHAMPVDAALAELDAHLAGLDDDEVARRHAHYGDNALPAARRRSLASVFLGQFTNPLIYLLLLAAGIAFLVSAPNDAIVIVVVVVVNATVGTVQEGRAERALLALRSISGQKTRVRRAGRERLIDALDLVPGDIVLVGAGDAVTADARLVEAEALQVSEAALTGESVPVAKRCEPVAGDAELADRMTMIYSGTHATAGRGVALVVATGAMTELGTIAHLAEAATPPKTPLERRVDRFGRIVMLVALAMLAVFAAVGFARGLPPAEIAMLGISQVVGLIPEGLPVAMTVALAIGVQRMAKRRAIVRRLAAVETLGSTTVICSDKTGTLTKNEMTVEQVEAIDRPELLTAAVLCNDAHDARTGDPTETALLALAEREGIEVSSLRAKHPRTAEIPFDASIKAMATAHGDRIYIKGAPEAVLPLCGDPPDVRASIDRMTSRALRVLAFAMADGPLEHDIASLGGRAKLLGLVGEIDPPREEAACAVAACRDAGIRPVMVTGDHKATGLAIARTLGIARGPDEAIDGRELETLSKTELARRLDRIAVFARVHPTQKVRIVDAYQARGEVVAMTGDGVNDAPALARANVGVAMGGTGTDVAKQAAEIVITDDKFDTIVAAVEEGRIVYRNIKKAVLFLLATSFAEVVVLLGAVALGYPAPFAAVQILWNNLVTEGVVTINLVMQPAEGDEMRRPPRDVDVTLITRQLLTRLAVMTPTIVACTLGWFIVRLSTGVPYSVAQTETFTLLAVCEWFNALNCVSTRRSAFASRPNRWLLGGLVIGNLLQVAVVFLAPLGALFHTVPLDWHQVFAIGAVASLVLWTEELRKLIARKRSARHRNERHVAHGAAVGS
jgi:Ca2+-transporting ATPase